MYFVDSSGHSFYQQSYNYKPIGYEYYKNKYIFWLDNKEHSYCSVNNYYIRPIYILSDEKMLSLNITVMSGIFSLISSKNINERFVNGEINLDEWDLVKELNFVAINTDEEPTEDEEPIVNDILELEVSSSLDETKYIYPFYVIGRSPEVGSFMTNVLISAEYEEDYDFCYITVGAEFNEESEILYINGRNMGIDLPREIIRSVYNGSYVNGEFDEVLYNEKLKEYLIEYMQIRGEIGNYNSAIQSLKWFGWGKHVSIVSLLQTDNQFIIQFVRDYFDTQSDILDSFKHFINSTLLSLIIWENQETGEYNDYDLEADFIGENQPVLRDLFNTQVAVTYGGVGEETYYYKNYYDFMFGEMLYKIAALKYYYEKYFLPVHLSIHNASLHHKVYANDIKMLCNATEHIVEPIVKIGLWDDPWVEFPLNNEIWLTEQVHYVDELYNEWKYDTLEEYAENKEIYYIHDTCANIPIKFLNYTTDEYGNITYNDEQVDVHLILEKITNEDDNVLYLNVPVNFYKDVIRIYDITDHEIDLNNTRISYSLDGGRTFSTYFFGIDSLKEILHEDRHIRINLNIDKDAVDDVKYSGEYIMDNRSIEIVIKKDPYTIHEVDSNGINRIIYVPGLDDINIDLFNNSADCYIDDYINLYLRVRIPNDRINKCLIETDDETNDITDDITIKYSPSSDIFYEADFTFNCAHNEYNDFVLYPKMFNNIATDMLTNKHGSNLTNKNIDITYFINSKFRLRMLVNNKWHEYEFIVRMPDISIEFGKLIYKYYDDELKYATRFNQLNKLTEDTLGFNSFMHEPRLARTNDINFLENFLRYLNISTARYIDGTIIPEGEFCQYIDVNITEDNETYTQRIYISNDNYGQDLIIPRTYFNYDVLFYLFLDERMLYIFADTGNNNSYEVLNLTPPSLIFEDSDLYNDINNYKKFNFNPVTNRYEVETAKGIREFPVKETLRSDISTFTQQYLEKHNITNKYKYLNQIHVFDLYRLNDHTGNNIISLQNNIDMMYHGIRFTHKSFLNGNMIHISGNTNNLFLNSDIRRTDNKTFESSLDPNDDLTIYDSYVNTYDDLTIYSAYEGDWIRPVYEDIDILNPTGYVYYEEINNGEPSGIYTTDSISVVSNDIQVHVKSDEEFNEFTHVETFEELNDLLNGGVIKYNETEYTVFTNEQDGSMYIDRDNVNTNKTTVVYKAEIICRDNETGDMQVVNPTYSEYYNTIRKYYMGLIDSPTDVTYLLRIRIFVRINNIVNNIQRIYTGEADYNDGVYSAIINGRRIILTPFYSEYDHNKDELFNVYSLIQQPGFDWIDINDLDNTLQYLNYNNETDYIDLSKPEVEFAYEDSDIEQLLSYRKLLILNVTSRLINSIKGYESTNIFDDYLNIYKDDNTKDTVNITFKIDSNQKVDNNCESEHNINENVTIKTILRAKYIEDEDREAKIGYEYFDDTMTINAKIVDVNADNDNDAEYHIDCGKSNDGSYITHTYTIESNSSERTDETDIDKMVYTRKYIDFVVFFVIIPKSEDTLEEGEFSIDINPEIRLVYKDYDILEYPTDSFLKTDNEYINYEADDFIDYTINDTTYKYGDCRESQAVIKLYNEFFKERTISYNDIFSFTSIDAIDELNIDKNLVEYDMYLVHDLKSWYIVYISKDTCDKSLALYDYEIGDNNEMVFTSKDGNQYKLINNISVKKFLVNRYVYSSKEGKNHFNVDDIIVGKVLNNERLPIDIFKTNKWEMTPVSFALDKLTHTATSNADMCIFDVPMYNNEYVKGYYDVTYRYTLDRISTQQYKKYGTIRID